MTIPVRKVWLLAALSTVWGCSSGSSPVDIGDSRTGQKLQDYAGLWQGYVEAYNFADGSDQVKISLDALGHGTLEIGDSPALPIATAEDIAYPASFNPAFGDPIPNLFPGFSYPVFVATVESARLRFSVNPWEVERDWCALQSSYALQIMGSTQYRCDPNSLCAWDGTSEISAECKRFYLCNDPACSCDAQGCSVYEAPIGQQTSYTKFDATLQDAGASLVGTLSVGFGSSAKPQTSITVRLKRMLND